MHILTMNPSAFTDLEGLEGFEDLFGDKVLGSCDSPNPQRAQMQEQQLHQQVIPPHNHMLHLDQHLQPLPQSSINMQNYIADPVQLHNQPQISPQAPFQNLNLHHERPTPQSDAQIELKHLREMLRMLQSQAESKEHETQQWQTSQQPDPQPQTETQPELLSGPQSELQKDIFDGLLDVPPEPEFQYLLTQVMHSHSSMESIQPIIEPVSPCVDPPSYSQRFWLDNAHTEDMEVDEIQRNISPKLPKPASKQQKQRRRKVRQSTNENPPKRRRVAKSSTKNSSGKRTFGSASNKENLNTLRIARSEAQVKCPSCNSRFPDSHAVRRHFRIVHASMAMKSKICKECLQPCSSVAGLRGHWKSAHVGELNFVCDACGAKFSKQRNLSWHKTKLHSDKPVPNWKNTKIHKCKLCNFTSDQKLKVAIHFFGTHTDAVDIECLGGCGRIFQSMSNAKVHFFNCTHRSLVKE